jgi:hypothetical protein
LVWFVEEAAEMRPFLFLRALAGYSRIVCSR